MVDSEPMIGACLRVRSPWFSKGLRPSARINLRAPIIALVLAATAIPIELRPPNHTRLDLDFGVSHSLINVVGYIPLGIVFGQLGLPWAAGNVDFRLCRDQPIRDDVPGPLACRFCCERSGSDPGRRRCETLADTFLAFGINMWSRFAAAILALAIALWAWAGSGGPINPRGWVLPGILEAQWKLHENQGIVTWDSSGHDLHGRFSEEPAHAAGVMGSAVFFDGRKSCVDCGRPAALRLVGSMTITAWIKSSSFPVDDAAIVSKFDHDLGYQLDATVDRGQRTVGFKLTNAFGELMARYGRTPLIFNTWYHVAGVYDAAAKTLDLYLNGELDDGFLLGLVTETQHPFPGGGQRRQEDGPRRFRTRRLH